MGIVPGLVGGGQMANATECPTRLHNERVRLARTAINILDPGDARQEENEELRQSYGGEDGLIPVKTATLAGLLNR